METVLAAGTDLATGDLASAGPGFFADFEGSSDCIESVPTLPDGRRRIVRKLSADTWGRVGQQRSHEHCPASWPTRASGVRAEREQAVAARAGSAHELVARGIAVGRQIISVAGVVFFVFMAASWFLVSLRS